MTANTGPGQSDTRVDFRGGQGGQVGDRNVQYNTFINQQAPAAEPAGGGLPGEVADFTGREKVLGQLRRRIGRHDPAGVAVAVHTIDGMGGVGKTALVVHLAHEHADRYRDGAFFIDLHGYTPGMAPVPPEAALGQLLQDAGVPASAIPGGLGPRQARWRSLLAGRRALIMFDNALNSDQVRPLLPQAARCLVLITSRRRLTGLPEADPLALGVLTPHEAASLFTRIVGKQRCPDRSQVDAVVRACGWLPLAVRIVAGRLRHDPAATVAALAADLADERARLTELSPEDAGVRAALQASLLRLQPDLQQAFRTVGLHPGPSIAPDAIAAIGDVGAALARRAAPAAGRASPCRAGHDGAAASAVHPARSRPRLR